MALKKITLFWMGMLCSWLSGAQTIVVLDETTRQPLSIVRVYSNSPYVSVLTNARGEADASLFYNADSIYFVRNGYITAVYSYQQLKSSKFIIGLKETSILLEETTVSANRWEENKVETPNRIEKIKMAEVAFQNPQTTADLLGTSGYAFIQKSQLGGGSPMLRGMATNRVLLVVDGVRMNTAIFRSGNLQNVISLDANALQGSEILFGPGSIMYGSDAIGGVMTFRTLETKFSDTTKYVASGNALTRVSTANSERTAHMDFNVGFKKISFLTSFTSSQYGDLRSGTVGGDDYFYRPSYVQTIDDKDYMVGNSDSALQVGSKYSQVNFMQKVRFAPSKNWEIDYGFHLSETSSFNRYDRLYVVQTSGPYKNKLRWAEWYYGPQKWNMNRLGITYSKSNRVFDHIRFIAAMQNFEESRYDREFMVRELRMQKENVRALSFNLDLDKKIGEKLSVYYGAEIVHNLVQSVASLTHVVTDEIDSTVTRYPDGSTWASYGIYANANYKLHKKLIVSGGVRYSMFKIKADFDTAFFPFPFTNTTMSNDAFNGALGLVYAPHKTWQIYVNAATGFRAPNVDDMGKVFESTPGYLVVPNPDLKPEYVYNAEIGTVKTFGNFLKVDVTGYYTWLKDAMARRDFIFNGQNTIRFMGNKSYIQALQNVAQIEVYGLQAGIDFYYKGFGIRGTFSYQNGKEQSEDSLIFYPLRHAAPMFGSTHFTYRSKKMKLDFYVLYSDKMDYEDLSLTERLSASYARDEDGLPYSAAWHTLNFKAAFYANQYVMISVGVENITNLLYRPYSSGINAPGRNFIACLRAQF
jgi:hemoglobin/transferrin/lactoferrin receptor protein